jgi:large repetitive protein
VDGGAYASATGTTAWSFTLSSALTNGAHTVTAKAVDASGNAKLASITITVANSYPVTGILSVSGSNTCTTTAATCNPGAAWSGSGSICDTSAGICGTAKASGNGNQAVSATVAFTKSGQAEGSATVSGSVSVTHSTTCGQECTWVPETCYDDDGNPYDCGYYDCYNECTEKVTGSGTLTGTLQ